MQTKPYHTLIRQPVGDKPLVFAFHGTGGDETQFDDLVRDILPGAGLVAPRGDVSEQGANRFFRRTGEGVYDMVDLGLRTKAMATFVKEARAAYQGRAAYAFGYSNGANILAALTFLDGNLFDRVALLHPLIPWTPPPQTTLSGKQVLISGGKHDPICPLSMTLALADYYAAQGTAVTRILHDGGHELRQTEIAALAAHFADV